MLDLKIVTHQKEKRKMKIPNWRETKENQVEKGKKKIVPEEKEAKWLELRERRKYRNGENAKMKKTKMREKEEREKHLKASPKNQDARKPNTSSRNVPTSSQSKYDMWPISMWRHHVTINAIETESKRPRVTWGNPSYS